MKFKSVLWKMHFKLSYNSEEYHYKYTYICILLMCNVIRTMRLVVSMEDFFQNWTKNAFNCNEQTYLFLTSFLLLNFILMLYPMFVIYMMGSFFCLTESLMNFVIILWVIRDVLIKTGLGVRSIKPMVIKSNASIIILFQLATHFAFLFNS